MRLARLRKYCGIYSQQKNGLRIDERSRISLFMRVRHVDQFAIHFHLTIPQKTASKYRVMRHASVTFDPAAPACDMPASLLTQRPRHATCQRHFRPSDPVMRHASVTFDPAASACDMPALLLIQRLRHATCRRHFRSSGLGMRHASSLLIQRPRHATCRRYFRSSGRVNPSCRLTFDPAEASTELPASLLIQRRRQLSCQRHF